MFEMKSNKLNIPALKEVSFLLKLIHWKRNKFAVLKKQFKTSSSNNFKDFFLENSTFLEYF